jgi:hypothetical protein
MNSICFHFSTYTHLCGHAYDGWRVVDDDYGQAVGKLQAESMMSTAASLFP